MGFQAVVNLSVANRFSGAHLLTIKTLSVGLCLILMGGQSTALVAAPWSNKRIAETASKAELAAKKRQWKKATKISIKAVAGCHSYYSPEHPYCLSVMRDASQYAHKADRHVKYAEAIAEAYHAAQNEWGGTHYTTRELRKVHYRVLLRQKNFTQAISVVQAMLDTIASTTADRFDVFDLQLQLYGLYHLTGQREQEKLQLQKLVPITAKLLGEDSEDYYEVLTALAMMHCENKDYYDFFTLVRKHRLGLLCSTR